MKLKLIALILGVVFGGYVVVQHGPPGLREKVLGLVSLVYDTFPGKAEERLPDEPAERSQVLLRKLDTNLYELGNLAKIVKDKSKNSEENKNESSGAKARASATSTAIKAPSEEKPKSFLENLFTPTDPKPEEKLQKVIENTQKIVSDLEQTNKKLQEEIRQLSSGRSSSQTANGSTQVPALTDLSNSKTDTLQTNGQVCNCATLVK